MKTVIILVNYNNPDDTQRCLESIKQYAPNCFTIVVDNASATKDIDDVCSKFENLKLIKSSINLGFGKGNNLGIQWALNNFNSQYIFILNNDTTIEEETIKNMEICLEKDTSIGLVVPRIVFQENPSELWYGGGEINWAKGSAKIPGIFGSANAELAMTAREVTFATGCAMFIRKEVLQQTSGFDSRFFMYEEDLELSLRISQLGWKLHYLPSALVYHKGQGSQRNKGEKFYTIQDVRNPRLEFYMYHITKNKFLTMYKHAKGLNAIKFWGIFPCVLILKSLYYFINGRSEAVKAIMKGFIDFLKERKSNFKGNNT